MALFEVVEFEGASDDTYAYRHPNRKLARGTKVRVSDGQQAFLYSQGRLAETFGPGAHQVQGDYLQGVSRITNLFYNKAPQNTEIWFVTLSDMLTIPWSTPGNFQVRDARYNATFDMRARADIGIKITDPAALVGQMKSDNIDTIKKSEIAKYITSRLDNQLIQIVSTAVGNGKWPYDEISQHLIEVSNKAKEALRKDTDDSLDWSLKKIGLGVTSMNVWSIALDGHSRNNAQVRDKLNAQGFDVYSQRLQADANEYRQKHGGYDRQTSRKFGVLNAAASNEGSGTGSSAMNMGMDLTMGVAMGQMMGKAFNQMGGLMDPTAAADAPATPASDAAPAQQPAPVASPAPAESPEAALFDGMKVVRDMLVDDPVSNKPIYIVENAAGEPILTDGDTQRGLPLGTTATTITGDVAIAALAQQRKRNQ
ncbi:MAG: SPFH domain-containing protein [Bifidobacteriaceae bacterium]|jgi:membrane protease subunit (stomatin/prohibitin family)|nr:SPFH domain-containing protein [Bifidobacteriaceae bacterium]